MDQSTYCLALRGRFAVVQPLSSASGHAKVYRVAEDESPGANSYVAKVVSLSGLDAKGRASAQQEVSLLKGLETHPNLIAYKESFMEEAGMLYIVMSLAEDGDLRCVVTESIAAKWVLPEQITQTWARQTMLGLRHLHSQGVVHRDLKSSNIFLCEGRRRIRIGDFGISRVLESTAFASSCVGTPAYMSPELMRNERYDYHVDMWALGCICFELCTLNLPFTANSLVGLACKVMESEPEWERWGEHHAELREVALRLLQKDVSLRPTASQLLCEPLFMEGGRASQEPGPEVWASLARRAWSPQDKRSGQPPMSQLTTAVTGDAFSSKGLSSKGNDSGQWAMTPRTPWEGGSTRASDSLSAASPGGDPFSPEAPVNNFADSLRRAKLDQDGYAFASRDEFADILATHQSQLLAELKSGPAGGYAGEAARAAPYAAAAAVPADRRPVYESEIGRAHV